MGKRFSNEKGIITLEMLLVAAAVLWFVLALATTMEVYYIKPIIVRAARDAQRELAVTHDQNQAKQMAINKVSQIATINWTAPAEGKTHAVFDPNNPNSNKDNNPDVFMTDDGTDHCMVTVRYHIVCLAPGFCKLIDPSAPALGTYINLEAQDNGAREYQPTP